MEEKRYEFTITIAGVGTTPEDAWEHAVEQLSLDPGATPEQYTEEEV